MRSTFRKNLCIALAAMFLGGVALGGLRVHGEEIDLAPNLVKNGRVTLKSTVSVEGFSQKCKSNTFKV